MFVFCLRRRTMEVVQSIHKILLVLFTFAFFWKLIRHMWSFLVLNIEKQPIRILVTGAAGQIGYAIAPMIARGVMLGPDQPVILHLLDLERAHDALKALQMELVDACFPLLHEVIVSIDVVEACNNVDIAILIGGYRRQEGMERKDVMSKNISIIKAQASALANYASSNCKVLVVANPANTNAMILKEFGGLIPTKNISCLSRLDHNRAVAQLAQKLNVAVTDIKNIIIWGNHSKTQYPDTNHTVVSTPYGPKSPKQLVEDAWLNADFIESVRNRGDAILDARKLSSAMSAACAACDHIHDWVLGTPKGSWVSMGVCSDGSYGIEPGLFCSFPVTCEKGEWSIVKGLKIDEFSREKIEATVVELMEERLLAFSCLQKSIEVST